MQDDLTPEQRARWEDIIERDLRDISEGKPQKYITGDEFWGKLTEAVMHQYETGQVYAEFDGNRISSGGWTYSR